MNVETAKKLGEAGVREYWALQQHLMTELDNHQLTDGYNFYTRCKVSECDGEYLICCEGTPIDGIRSSRRDVIQALFDSASSQLGK